MSVKFAAEFPADAQAITSYETFASVTIRRRHAQNGC
jgi:hypothetical protein